jgi:selenide,water dikinase
VGFATHDDAAVYRLSATEAVVSTVDFFPPVVDDPFAFGQIAAANALSDVWAMGARPLFALNLVAFPTQALPMETLARILEGGQSKTDEAGIPILGGHSVDDPEPKYGMAVTGVVHPRRILTNAGGRPGDVLLLTKPLGTGIATTAIKRGIATPELESSVVELMSRPEPRGRRGLRLGKFPVHALTDVTGFGLLGHLAEMALGAKLRARLFLEQGADPRRRACARGAGRGAGRDHGEPRALLRARALPDGLPDPVRWVLADAQTNGGLLAAVPRDALPKAERALARVGVELAVIGELIRGRPRIDVG